MHLFEINIVEPRYTGITLKKRTVPSSLVSRYLDTLKVLYEYRVVPRYIDIDTI